MGCHSPGCAEIGYVDHTGCHMDHTVRHQLVTSATKSVPYHAVRQDLRGDAVAVEAQVARALAARGRDDPARVRRQARAVALQVAFERQILKPVFSLDRL